MKKKVLLITLIFCSIIAQARSYTIDDNSKEKLKTTPSEITDTNLTAKNARNKMLFAVKSKKLTTTNLDATNDGTKKETPKTLKKNSFSTVNIPDANFEQFLVDRGHDTNGLNGNILTTDAQALTTLVIPNSVASSINDLTGIEAFTQLTELDVQYTNITSLDLSQNTLLVNLNCRNNKLTSLNVSQNINLINLSCSSNSLTSLDISQNNLLETLGCSYNNLTSLDISQNNLLTALSCRDNQITNLDVTKIIDLTLLNVNNNNLTTFDVSKNVNLTYLGVGSPTLNALDLSNNVNLETLSLESVNINVDISNNVNLTDLFLNDATINAIDLSSNINLKNIYTGGSSLTSIDLSNNLELEYLNMHDNRLSSIDLTSNTKLSSLYIPGNSLTSIDLSNNSNLLDIILDDNALTSLDVSNNPKLKALYCENNNLTELNLGPYIYPDLGYILLGGNALADIDVSKIINLLSLDLSNNSLSSLDVSNNTDLSNLNVSFNQIDSLNLSSNSNLRGLNVSENLLEYLNVKNGNNANITVVFTAIENPNLTCIQVDDIAYANANFNKDASASFNLGCGVNTAATNGNWSDPASWSTGVVPTSDDNVTIPSGTTLQIGDEISEINSLVNEGDIVIGPTFSLKSNTNLVNNGTIIMDSENNDSSVLFVKDASTGTVTYKRGGLKANAWSLVTPPVSGQKIQEFALNADNDIRINTAASPNQYAIGYYDDTEVQGQKWKYYTTDVASSLTFTAGNSYSMSRSTDGSVSFTGTLTTTDASKTLNAGEWNAIGNPFTTYYPANKNSDNSFLNQNFDALDDEFKGIYLWSTVQNKFVAVSEIDINNRSLTPGQGFFVKLKVGATNVQFNEDKRTLKPNDAVNTFAKNNDFYVELALENENYKVETAIKFYPNATLGFDTGYDIRNFDGASFDVFSHLADKSSDKNFSIQSVPSTDMENTIVPLGLSLSDQENVKFTINAVNLPEGINVFIEDRTLNTYSNISIDNSYLPDFSENKNLKDRFFVHFKTAKALSANTSTLNDINIFVNNRVLYVEGVKTEKELKIFNMMGQELLKLNLDTDSNEINIPEHINSGIYLISIKTGNQTNNQKILLK